MVVGGWGNNGRSEREYTVSVKPLTFYCGLTLLMYSYKQVFPAVQYLVYFHSILLAISLVVLLAISLVV